MRTTTATMTFSGALTFALLMGPALADDTHHPAPAEATTPATPATQAPAEQPDGDGSKSDAKMECPMMKDGKMMPDNMRKMMSDGAKQCSMMEGAKTGEIPGSQPPAPSAKDHRPEADQSQH